MNKKQFLSRLKKGLRHLPRSERRKYLDLYSESIADRIEEGATEEEAVASFGTPTEEAEKICAEAGFTPPSVNEKRKLKAWEIVLLAVGSPIWLSLGIAVFAVVLAFFIVFWALDIVLWALELCFPACGLAGLVGGAALICNGHFPQGLFLIGCGLICVGLGVFWFFLCHIATKGVAKLTSETALFISKIITGRK